MSRATAIASRDFCVVALGALPSPCLGVEGDSPIGPRLGLAFGGVYGQARAAYTIAEWSPIPRLFLGTGIGGDTMIEASFASCQTTCPAGDWAAYSVPLIVGIDVARLPGGALRLDLEAAGGIEPRTSVFGWHTGFTFGWALD